MARGTHDQLVFRKQDIVGVNDAEDDQEYLLNCFVDIGDYDLIKDFNSKKCLVLGRTGTGKTALLTKLRHDKGDRVIVIKPEALAMQHISNSTIIRYMHDLGIDLNTFFKLLWRHAICVEIFHHHFKIVGESEGEDLMDRLRARFRKENPHHYRALNYLEEWKNSFWKETDSHVTEMITKTEAALEGSIKTVGAPVTGKVSSGQKSSEEEKVEVRKRAQEVVDNLQMREVIDLLDMLDEVIEDKQKQYYLVIDKLDEGWVDDSLRYRLIKALLETVRDINRINNIKPIVVLRMDLLGHVFDLTQDTGFQEEKYASLYLQVRWTRTQLVDLIDQRLDYLLKARYSSQKVVTHKDVLPATIKGQSTIDYILDRTLMRPRDVIDFFNLCIQEAVETRAIDEKMLEEAEREYSRQRLESIYYEWFSEYPSIKFWLSLLRRKDKSFHVADLEDEVLKSKCLEYVVDNMDKVGAIKADRLYILAEQVANGSADDPTRVSRFRNTLAYVFYITGLAGIQLEDSDKAMWSQDMHSSIRVDDITPIALLSIHPCFWSALNVKS